MTIPGILPAARIRALKSTVTGLLRVMERLQRAENVSAGTPLIEQIGTILLMPSGRIYFANETFRTWFGYSLSDLKSRHLLDIIYEPDVSHLLDILLKLFSENSNGDLILNFRIKDQRSHIFYVDASLEPILEHGQICGAAVIIHQVNKLIPEQTMQKHIPREIKEYPEHLLIFDSYYHIRFVNPAFEKLTGYTQTELIGRPAKTLRTKHFSHQHFRDLQLALQAGKQFRGYFGYRKKSGELCFEKSIILPCREYGLQSMYYIAVGYELVETVPTGEPVFSY